MLGEDSNLDRKACKEVSQLLGDSQRSTVPKESILCDYEVAELVENLESLSAKQKLLVELEFARRKEADSKFEGSSFERLVENVEFAKKVRLQMHRFEEWLPVLKELKAALPFSFAVPLETTEAEVHKQLAFL